MQLVNAHEFGNSLSRLRLGRNTIQKVYSARENRSLISWLYNLTCNHNQQQYIFPCRIFQNTAQTWAMRYTALHKNIPNGDDEDSVAIPCETREEPRGCKGSETCAAIHFRAMRGNGVVRDTITLWQHNKPSSSHRVLPLQSR